MYYSTLQIFYLIKRSWICIFVGPIAQLVRATNCELDRDVSPQAYTLQKGQSVARGFKPHRPYSFWIEFLILHQNIWYYDYFHIYLYMNYNDYNTQKLRGLKRKLELIKSRGGKCELCGYDRNIAVLEFHHINPDEKEFQLDMRHLSNTSLERLKEEADKSQLLCANCHREVHNPHLGMDEVEDLVNTEAKDKTSFENMTGSVCPVCGKRFPKSKGKIYCSKECRDADKHYPSLEEVNEQYEILKNWEKVAQHFGLTRRVIQGIRKKHS